MTTTAILNGLRIAQHLVTEAGDHGIMLSQVAVTSGGHIDVHLDGYLDGRDQPVFASYLLDVLDLPTEGGSDFPEAERPFRYTSTTYRGSRLGIFGSLPTEPADSDA